MNDKTKDKMVEVIRQFNKEYWQRGGTETTEIVPEMIIEELAQALISHPELDVEKVDRIVRGQFATIFQVPFTYEEVIDRCNKLTTALSQAKDLWRIK